MVLWDADDDPDSVAVKERQVSEFCCQGKGGGGLPRVLWSSEGRVMLLREGKILKIGNI